MSSYAGNQSPENQVYGIRGDTYQDNATGVLYRKETGTIEAPTASGWIAVNRTEKPKDNPLTLMAIFFGIVAAMGVAICVGMTQYEPATAGEAQVGPLAMAIVGTLAGGFGVASFILAIVAYCTGSK